MMFGNKEPPRLIALMSDGRRVAPIERDLRAWNLAAAK